jgi:very-short-patch-repair endonuclease
MNETNDEFIYDLEPLISELKSQKCRIIEYMKKNMKENINFSLIKNKEKKKGRGGSNLHKYYLNKESYELLKNSYNLRNKRIINDKNINILLPIETRTISIIINAFQDIFTCETQKYIGIYRYDLCILEHKIIIECDEYGHKYRNIEYEKIRDKYMIDNDYTVLRFNPNISNFNIISVINIINKIIFGIINKKNIINI